MIPYLIMDGEQKMKISIITPSFNSEDYILNNLKSVHLNQKGDFSIEQIIVDGGSADKTLNIINTFRDSHKVDIKIIVDKDKSMYDAINKGLKAMSGDIWACLNTDDEYNPGVFSAVVEEFRRGKDVDVVYGYLDIVGENGKFQYTSYLLKFDLNFLVLSRGCRCINQPATFLRKSVVDKVGYFSLAYRYASDYDYLIRVGRRYHVKRIDQSFTKFMIRASSLSCGAGSKTTLEKEAEMISNYYLDKYEIRPKNLYLKYLSFYLNHIKPENFPYILKKLPKITFLFFTLKIFKY